MQFGKTRCLRGLLLGCVLAGIAGCAELASVPHTLDLRDVQQQFNQAVQLDNVAGVDAFAGGQSEALYASVIAALDEQQIAALDARLQANAWLLRAVSEWRTRLHVQALASAERGVALPSVAAQSRDQVLLTVLPALVIDSDLRQRMVRDRNEIPNAEYLAADGYRRNFETAVGKLKQAQRLVGEATPAGVVHYLEYQKWRLLTNWRYVISLLPSGADRQAAKSAAATVLDTGSIEEAALQAAAAIPDGEPLRQLIRAQQGALR